MTRCVLPAIVCWGDAWHLPPVVSVFGSCLAIGCSHHPTCGGGGGNVALVASAESCLIAWIKIEPMLMRVGLNNVDCGRSQVRWLPCEGQQWLSGPTMCSDSTNHDNGWCRSGCATKQHSHSYNAQLSAMVTNTLFFQLCGYLPCMWCCSMIC